jgi:predicted PurR-regulated permease PerM
MEMSQRSPRVRVYDAQPQDGSAGRARFTQRMLIAVGIVVIVGLLLWFFGYAFEVLLVVFAGVLLAVFLRGLSDWVSAHTPLSEKWALGAIVLGIIALFGVGSWLLAPSVAEQFDQLIEQVPQSAGQVEERIRQYRWGRFLLERAPNVDVQELAPSGGDVVSQLSGVFSTALGGLVNFLIILFVGLYLAIDPTTYTNGLVRLVSIPRRPRARQVLQVLGYTLQRWLIGRMFLMMIIGALITLGLWLLGIPLALTLGIIAALLTFIPNIGPVISAIPAVLLGLSSGPLTALYVVLLYLVVQTIESYVFAPLVEQRTVLLPPVLVITSQVILGISLGVLGLLLATPLFAVVLVLVKMLYVQDVLGDDEIELPGVDDGHTNLAS